MTKIILVDKRGSLLIFCPLTFDMYWRQKWYVSYPKVPSNPPYLRRTERNKTILFARMVMNAKPDERVDHINGNTLDNRLANLRICSEAQNNYNRKKRAGSSKYIGVCKHSNGIGWSGKVVKDGKLFWSGYFLSEEEAAKERDLAASKAFGEFCHKNFN